MSTPSAPAVAAFEFYRRQIRDVRRRLSSDADVVQVVAFGWHPDCDVRLDQEFVSPFHAVATQSRGGVVRITDMGSLNGTFANDVRQADWFQVRPGDTVRLGRVRLPWNQ